MVKKIKIIDSQADKPVNEYLTSSQKFKMDDLFVVDLPLDDGTKMNQTNRELQSLSITQSFTWD